MHRGVVQHQPARTGDEPPGRPPRGAPRHRRARHARPARTRLIRTHVAKEGLPMSVRRSVVSGWFALALVLAGGCSSANKGNLTLQGDESQTLFAQSFNQAYISGSREGEYDLMLLQDPAMAKPEKGNKPLQPLSGGDLRQIVHVHVYWQASGGSVTKDGVV